MIPYTVDRRADTGVTNVTLGIWLFLASEVMLFGALFSAYALIRVAAPDWPRGADVLSLPLGLVNTVVLMLMTTAAWRARSVAIGAVSRWLVASSVLAVVFLAVKSIEWQGEIAAGLLPRTSSFMAMYFTLTGLHALHVIGGLVANGWVIAGRPRVDERMTKGRVHALSLYWVLVDVVWVVLLVLLYLS